MANIYNPNAINPKISNGATVGGIISTVNAGTGYTINTGACIGTSNITIGSVTGISNSWGTSNTQLTGGNGKPVMTMPYGKDEIVLEKDATLNVKGNVVINGVDLEERLKTIEKVLLIPERDVILEHKHPKLKKLYDEYINALGKYRTFEAIKGDDNGTT